MRTLILAAILPLACTCAPPQTPVVTTDVPVAATGTASSAIATSPEPAGPTWQWNDDDTGPTSSKPLVLPYEESSIVVFADDGGSSASRYVGSKRLWKHDVKGSGLAAVVGGKQVFLVEYSRIASGATAVALAIDDGRELWRHPLVGLGPVSHSKYQNAVQVKMSDGKLTVFGRETQGRYIEVVDPEKGTTLSNQKL